MEQQFIINGKDSVEINLSPVNGRLVGHKYALHDIQIGELVIKYGMPIGTATEFIPKGAHVHTHNIKTTLNDVIEYTYEPDASHALEFEKISAEQQNSVDVKVYQRKFDLVGIRNEIWIIPTVGCVNGVANRIIDTFKNDCLEQGINLNSLENFDGIFAHTHQYGCSQMGDDHVNTRKTLQNIAVHPNAGGVLVIGLGCENNQIDTFRETMGDYDEERVRFLVAQKVEDEIAEGVKLVKELFANLLKDKRVTKPLSSIRVGLECGGSDGLSGITANPLIGRFSDYIIARGGTSVLTEVPEMFGAETILMNRCIDEKVFLKTVDMVNGFKDYYKKHDQVIYENPSPGNKNGGISTLEDKSLGCTTKAGSSQVIDVLKHTEKLSKHGLNLISAPGNDAVATTALGMCGCHMVLFSTGRGTPFGGFIPTMKISTNSALYALKPNWIDFNAGQLLDGVSMDDMLALFVQKIVSVINGEKTQQEKNNYREISIFKSGVTL